MKILALVVATSAIFPRVFGLDLHNLPDTFYFDEIPMGNAVINLGPDIRIRAFKEPRYSLTRQLLPALPIMFDTANPGSGFQQERLGSPNEDYGGPGVGEGGQIGADFENDKPLGNVLIISSNEDIFKPDANLFGGVISMDFKIPTNIDSVGLLQAYRALEVEAVTVDGKQHRVWFISKGLNAHRVVPIRIPNVIQLVFRFDYVAAITHLNFKAIEEKCPVSKVIDFSEFEDGEKLNSLPGGIGVEAIKSDSQRILPAMILNTSDPTEPDFGSPHNSVAGPGKGPDGRLGMPFENIEKHGNALIISRDQKSRNPVAARAGGKFVFYFPELVYLSSIGILNNVQGVVIKVETFVDNMFWIDEIETNAGGRNSFQEVFLWLPGVKKMEIEFIGTGALTFIKLGTC